MAKKTKVIIEIDAKGTPKLKGQTKAVKDQTKALKNQGRAAKTTEKKARSYYQRQEKGVIGVANQTKSFSKMAQTMDGGGGAGGLVRAYALLAANVFALSMAFGVLSRAAQVDTLTDSMRRLEEVGGQSVRAIAKGLQEASGRGLDFAEAMRATSLALSAGFDATAITELGEVARNAAVSLGRPMGDALDRIFRGVIKVEPELLDEIGLFVRVREAAAKYASTLGIAASELTEMQRRQAFANEAISQGQEKFAAFADIETDQFSKLAAAFADIAQSALSLVNTALRPLINLLVNSKELMVGLFMAITGFLLSKAIPAMGLMTQTINQQANTAVKRHNEYLGNLQESSAKRKIDNIARIKGEEQIAQAELKAMKRAKKRSKDYTGQRTQSAELKKVNKEYAKAKTHEQKIIALTNKRKVLNKSIREGTRKNIKEARAGLQDEINKRKQILTLRQQSLAVGKADFIGPAAGKPAFKEGQRLAVTAAKATSMASIAGTASTQGFIASLKGLSGEFDNFQYDMGKAGKNVGSFGKGMFYLKGSFKTATISLQGLMATMMPWIMAIMILIPIMTVVLKKFGMWNKEHKAFQDAQEKTNLILDNYLEKLEKQKEAMKEGGTGTLKFREANTAMQLTLSETTTAILAEIEAMQKFKREGADIAVWWVDFQQKFGAESPQEKGARALQGFIDNMDELSAKTRSMVAPEVKDVALAQGKAATLEADSDRLQKIKDDTVKAKKENRYNLITGALKEGKAITILGKKYDNLKDILAELGRISTAIASKNAEAKTIREGAADITKLDNELIIKQNKTLNKQTTAEAAAQKNLNSVMEGAKETVRTYMDLFITKTAIDKPMATFAQLTASVMEDQKDMELSDEVRASALQEINNRTHEINILMSEQSRRLYRMAETDEERMQILEDQEQSYRKQQVVLIKNKAEMAKIAAVSKQISKLTKEVGQFTALKLTLDTKILRMKLVEKKAATDNYLDQLQITREELIQLKIKSDSLLLLAAQAGIRSRMANASKDEAEADRHIAEERAIQLDLEVMIGTIAMKTNKAIFDITKKRLTAQKKLNDAVLKGLELDQKIENFRKRGTTDLTRGQEYKVLIQAEEKRLELALKRAKVEKALARVQMTILILTMKTMQTEITQYNNEIAELNKAGINIQNLQPINIEQLTTDLNSAADVLVDTIDEGLQNAAKSFKVSVFDLLSKGMKSFATDIKPFAGTDIAQQVTFGEGIHKEMEKNEEMVNKLQAGMNKAKEALNEILITGGDLQKGLAISEELDRWQTKLDELDTENARYQFMLLRNQVLNFTNAIREMSEGGALVATVVEFGLNMADTMKFIQTKIDDGIESTEGRLMAAASVISGIASIAAAASKQKIAAIDREIEAEKKRDGKSAQSLAKLKSMEAKKTAMAKKNFEMQKKLAMASVMVSTAMAVMQVWANPVDWFKGWAGWMTPIILGLGAAQLAIIAGTSFQGGGSIESAGTPAKIEVGSRTNKVNVADQASAGELAYLRGERGIGTSSTSFKAQGGAAGLSKSYAEGSILVGERGPEIVQPTAGFDVVPNDMIGSAKSITANFSIHAIDAVGVEEVLLAQQGNIISMIRSAANDYGENFLEIVDTDSYGDFSSGGGVDY